MPIRRFVLDRVRDISGVSGTGLVAEGAVFTDGTVALHWPARDGPASTAIYANINDLLAIHGHHGATRLLWLEHQHTAAAIDD
jgi:hypothetical protein